VMSQTYRQLHDDEPVTMGILEPSAPPAYTPSPQPQVVYVVQQVEAPERRWKHGIFECFRDIPNCLNAWCFPCWRTALSGGRSGVFSCGFLITVTVGLWMLMQVTDSLAKRSIRPEVQDAMTACKGQLQHAPGQPVNTDDLSTECQEKLQIVFTHLLPYFAIFVFISVTKLLVSCVVRGRIREKYQIPGSACEDTCCHMFCHTCAVAQEGYTVDMMELGRPSAFACTAETPAPAPMSTVPVELGQLVHSQPYPVHYPAAQ